MSFDETFLEYASLRRRKEDLEDQVKKLNEDMDPLKKKLKFYLDEMGVTYVKRPEGVLILKQKYSFKVPKGENLQMFFQYLREQNLFDAYATVNSAQVNSYGNEAMEQALERGETNFEIPGLGKPVLYEDITFRKG